MDAAWTLDGSMRTVASVLFGTTIELDNVDGAHDEYVASCVALFNALPDATTEHLYRASIRYCTDYLDAIGQPQQAFATPRDVLTQIHPVALVIPPPDDRSFASQATEPVVNLVAGCTWDIEHGINWLVRGDHVLYVGPNGESDPWSTASQGGYA